MDWETRSCSRQGHITYRPDEPELASRLTVETPVGPAWRCLRCGVFVPGAPKGTGPADDAPIVIRGRALRDAVILRVLAVERFVRGLLMLAAAFAVMSFRSSQANLQQLFDRDLPAARPLADKLNVDLDHSSIVRLLRHALTTKSSTLGLVAAALTVYGVLQLAEGVGLWLLKRWGEYLAVVATAAFIPLEIYELVDKTTLVRIGALVLNVSAVLYILLTKRLFGLRGGHAAYLAERHTTSLLEVDASAGVEPDQLIAPGQPVKPASSSSAAL